MTTATLPETLPETTLGKVTKYETEIVRHLSEAQGPRVGRIDTITFSSGLVSRVEWIYQIETGKLLFIR